MKFSEWLPELRLLLSDYNFSKTELLIVIVIISLVYRLPNILTHRREMAVIKADFAFKGTKLRSQLELQKAKRLSKSSKGKK